MAGTLVIIGGREDMDDRSNRTILREVAKSAATPKARLLIVTVATHLPEELAGDYRKAFKGLGVRLFHLENFRWVVTGDKAAAARAFETSGLGKLSQANPGGG